MTNTNSTPSQTHYDSLGRSASDPTLDQSDHAILKTTNTSYDKVSPLISQPRTTITELPLPSPSTHSNDDTHSVATNSAISIVSSSTTDDNPNVRKFKCVFWPDSKSIFGHHVKGTLSVSPTAISFKGKHFDRVSLSFPPSTITSVEKHNVGLKNGVMITKTITGERNSITSGKMGSQGKKGDGTQRVYFFTFASQRGIAAACISMMASESKKLVEATTIRTRNLRPDTVTKKSSMDDTTSTTTDAERLTSPIVQTSPPAPDATLSQKMDIIISKKMKRISVSRFYELIFSEGVNTTAMPFYGPWLERRGSFDVVVGDWEFGRFRNGWCGEEYTQRRTVTFKFKRTSHTYMGPPIADVTHTHHCRIENKNDRCVLQMTVSTAGIPFAETFNVEIRWVVSRIGAKETDVSVECGVFVNFLKSSILQGKIRSGTTVETTKTQNDHYANMEKTVALFIAAASGSPTAAAALEKQGRVASPSPSVTKTRGGIIKSGATTTTMAVVASTDAAAAATTGGGGVAAYYRYSLVICSLLLLLWQYYGGYDNIIMSGVMKATTPMSPMTTTMIEEMREMQNELRSLLLEMRERQDELKELILLSKETDEEEKEGEVEMEEEMEEEVEVSLGHDDGEKEETKSSVTDEM